MLLASHAVDVLDQVREHPLGVFAVVACWMPVSLVLAGGGGHTLVDDGVVAVGSRWRCGLAGV